MDQLIIERKLGSSVAEIFEIEREWQLLWLGFSLASSLPEYGFFRSLPYSK